MSYDIAIENFNEAWPELEPLCRRHYGEMQARMAAEGMTIGDFKPRLNVYGTASHLLCFVVRIEGEAVGYAFIWLTQDMHNSEPIAMEDTIYMRPDHRNGIGRRFTKQILAELKARGCVRAHVTIATDLRVAKMCERVGFKRSAIAMTYFLQEA
ncbi:MAG: GNAT family N-acetyltransferase [Mesorhizobium sp.]|uniref:GNAT family N-acetyltransferase n=1 Tax=unclassified Mesorhizobium TaxID=325217 RepID=UPI000F74E0F5|nr:MULTISPECIES: GNAT family N-acetyltransferase [unclassified Mesorhizobium]AZO47105.1 GNAT family N-acetyltransferase [Mesorhizobium sp. M4B.F.Ca.ET.058.02.1.1]RVC43467.1 GNAT family N-acetyltransferase [Mesorhizobium sp. M4A.F.Ca.ET.090.04.2.1]RWC57759.1 MAG: GNAT family N-acetyltransferase [Mesorhizobium sp.]RWD13839.1 MAG: GNAT family N-acetyltransferase [Mesorhizobium sp.]RWD55553.1 MAG: GNAT family N-acetyltransferase [Mesorhizobium sp.]